MVLFCQVDVTGRTEEEPAARRLSANIVDFADGWSAPAERSAVYAGEAAGLEHLKAAGTAVTAYDGQALRDNQVLVVGPGAGGQWAANAAPVAKWIKSGGHVLALGLSQQEAEAVLPSTVHMEVKEHISSYFAPSGPGTAVTGVGCGDLMIRDPRQVPLVVGGAVPMGDGVVAVSEDGNVVFCQLAPWQFDYKELYNTKPAFRHLSFAVSRILGNMGVEFRTPLLKQAAAQAGAEEKRWLNGLYLEEPVLNDDDPYRFYRW
jgi:hypothetical protein